MATTQVKADNFIRDMQNAEKEARQKYGIERTDVIVSITVSVQTQTRYSSTDDED